MTRLGISLYGCYPSENIEKLDKIIKSKKEDYQIEISISHSRKYATAMAIIL